MSQGDALLERAHRIIEICQQGRVPDRKELSSLRHGLKPSPAPNAPPPMSFVERMDLFMTDSAAYERTRGYWRLRAIWDLKQSILDILEGVEIHHTSETIEFVPHEGIRHLIHAIARFRRRIP
jgi:hypothetical protein